MSEFTNLAKTYYENGHSCSEAVIKAAYDSGIFKSDNIDLKALFDNPSPTNDRFTNQMQEFRDVYFESFPNADKNAYYIFIIPGFVNLNQNALQYNFSIIITISREFKPELYGKIR